MTAYFTIFLLLTLFAFAESFNLRYRQKVALLFVCVVVLSLFAGLRYGDQDYENYVDSFEKAVHITGSASISDVSPDVGYSFLSVVLGLFTSNAVFLFLIVAILAVSINLKSYNYYTRYVFLAVLLYFVHFYALKEMIQIRAGLACALSLYNMRNAGNGRLGRFLVLQALATTIHMGAVICFVVYAVKKNGPSIRVWYWIISACFCVGMVYPLGAIIKSLPGMELLVRVQTYSNWGEYSEGIGILTNLATLKQLFVSLVCLYYHKTLCCHIKHFNVLLPAYLVSTCWLMIWNDFAILAARVATFLSIGEPVLMASFVTLATPKSRPIIAVLLIAVALLFLFTNINSGKITPYELAF